MNPVCESAVLKTVVAVVLLVTASHSSAQDEAYDMSGIVRTPEWKDMTWKEKIEAATVPQEILDKMNTAALVETCLMHPFSWEFVPASVPARGIEHVVSLSTCFQELVKRKDGGRELMAKYMSIDPAKAYPDWGRRMKVEMSTQLAFLELMLAHPGVLSNLENKDKEDLLRYCTSKFGERFGVTVMRWEAISLVMARVLRDLDAAGSVDKSTVEGRSFWRFVAGEEPYTVDLAGVISNLSSTYLNRNR